MAMMMKSQVRVPIARRSAVPALPARSNTIARAQAQPKSGLAKLSENMGMPTDDGVFGFTPFAEMWVGRWAQMGFVSSICVEFFTGRGTLQQIGLPSPSSPILIAIVAIVSTASLIGTAKTIQRATSKQMSKSEIGRYKNFLGLNNADDYKEEAMAMKKRGDFTTPGNNTAAIDATRAQGSPVDSFLSTNEIAEGQQAAQAMKSTSTTTISKEQEAAEVAAAEREMKAGPSASEREAAARSYAETMYFGEANELAYARDIELTNGRWAMMGFLAAIVVEAQNGQGIIGQVIDICKWSGLLGEKSGF